MSKDFIFPVTPSGDDRIPFMQLSKNEISGLSLKMKNDPSANDAIAKISKSLERRRNITIAALKKYIKFVDGKAYLVVPSNYNELGAFVNNWLPVCEEGTEKALAKFKRAMKIRNIFNGYGLSHEMETHMAARFIAGVILEQQRRDYEFFIAYLNSRNIPLKHGSTHIQETYIFAKIVLENTKVIENDRGTTVSIYDDLRAKFIKKIKLGKQMW